ncbi:unnamed protein product [Musa textilis]
MTVRLPSSWNALIAGYTRVGAFAAAENLFAEMPDKIIISWTAMISGYCQNGLDDRALSLFEDMRRDDSEVKPNRVTVVSVLPACSRGAHTRLRSGMGRGFTVTRVPWASTDTRPCRLRSLDCTQSAETLSKLVILLIGFQRMIRMSLHGTP